MRAIGIIPARFASTRFPGKPLAPILGKPMVQWVYDRALEVKGLDSVLVATDDERVVEAVRAFGGRVVMTPADCASGSDRVWRAVEKMECEVVVNLQGDEPLLNPEAVEALLRLMNENEGLLMGTLVASIEKREDYEEPSVVKVAVGEGGRCLYFSRSPIPYLGGKDFGKATLWRHVGVYAFRKDFLGRFTGWPTGTLEGVEKLEQLRALERGVEIRAVAVEWPGTGIDRPEDISLAEELIGKERAVRPQLN